MEGVIVIMCAVMAIMALAIGLIAILCITIKAENEALRRLIGDKGSKGRDAEETEGDFICNDTL
jgi:hypothetical protein